QGRTLAVDRGPRFSEIRVKRFGDTCQEKLARADAALRFIHGDVDALGGRGNAPHPFDDCLCLVHRNLSYSVLLSAARRIARNASFKGWLTALSGSSSTSC